MPNPNEVDVIVGTRNFGRFIREAIESALGQQGADVHVTVIDDGSVDGTAEIVSSLASERVTMLRRERSYGIGSAWNLGISMTSRPYVALMDADNVWPADRLEALLAVIANGHDLAYGATRIFYDTSHDAPGSAGASGSVIESAVPGTTLISRRAVQRVGPFDTAFPYLTFPDWLAAAESRGLKLGATDTVVLNRRIHKVAAPPVNLADRRISGSATRTTPAAGQR